MWTLAQETITVLYFVAVLSYYSDTQMDLYFSCNFVMIVINLLKSASTIAMKLYSLAVRFDFINDQRLHLQSNSCYINLPLP